MPGTTTNLGLRYPVASDAPDGAGAFYNLAQDIEDRFGRTATAAANLAVGTRYGQRAIVGTTEYRWNGTAWQPWDSEWFAWNPSNANAAFATTAGLIRYRSGEAAAEFSATVNNQGAGQVTLTIPSGFQAYGGAQPKGRMELVKSDGTSYALFGTLSGTTMYIGYTPAGQNGSAASSGTGAPIAWLNNTFRLSLSWAIQ